MRSGNGFNLVSFAKLRPLNLADFTKVEKNFLLLEVIRLICDFRQILGKMLAHLSEFFIWPLKILKKQGLGSNGQRG